MRRVSIVQGENAVVAEPHVIVSTLLGSCVAACLYDPVAKVGGMNHFLLGEPGADHRVAANDMARYGVHAMELLINAMMKAGAERGRLRANLYGGANIIAGLTITNDAELLTKGKNLTVIQYKTVRNRFTRFPVPFVKSIC